VIRAVTIEKQKSPACAAFLGVRAFSRNVLDRCCIRTTILEALATIDPHMEPKTPEKAALETASAANQPLRENTDSVALPRSREISVPRKRPQAIDAAAFRNWLAVIPA
jgi:hypothetical protein